MTDAFSVTLQAILKAYRMSGVANAKDQGIAKRLLKIYDPDVIMICRETELLDGMIHEGVMSESGTKITERDRLKHIRRFQTFLCRVNTAGTHPEWFRVIG